MLTFGCCSFGKGCNHWALSQKLKLYPVAPLGLWVCRGLKLLHTCRPAGAIGQASCPRPINSRTIYASKEITVGREQRSLFPTKQDVETCIFRRERRFPFHLLNVNRTEQWTFYRYFASRFKSSVRIEVANGSITNPSSSFGSPT